MKNKNLLSGAYGRVKDKGGSRYYTTPKTVLVPPDYEIDTGVEGDFVTCSLDGRLWVFGKNLVVLKWNEETQKMELAGTQELDEDEVFTYGYDWIIVDNTFFQSTNNAPYFFSQEINFTPLNIDWINLHRSSEYWGTGIYGDNRCTRDRFISILYETNGMFLRKEYLEKYFPLPSIGNYQIVNNFLISNQYSNKKKVLYIQRDPTINLFYFNNELWGISNNSIGKIYLAPIFLNNENEFPIYYLYIKSSIRRTKMTDTNMFIYEGHTFLYFQQKLSWENAKKFCENLGGHLATAPTKEKLAFLTSLINQDTWLGGYIEGNKVKWITNETHKWNHDYLITPYRMWNAKLYLLTSGFIEINVPHNMYFICEFDFENNDISDRIEDIYTNLPIILDNENDYMINIDNKDIDYSLVKKSKDGKLFKNNEWTEILNNKSKIFFDYVNSCLLCLYPEKEALYINLKLNKKLDIETSNIFYWIAPENRINIITDKFIVSPMGNNTLVTHLDTEFNRDLLICNNPLLTQKLYSGKNLFMGTKKKNQENVITINKTSLSKQQYAWYIDWENIYQKEYTVELINIKRVYEILDTENYSSQLQLFMLIPPQYIYSDNYIFFEFRDVYTNKQFFYCYSRTDLENYNLDYNFFEVHTYKDNGYIYSDLYIKVKTENEDEDEDEYIRFRFIINYTI